MSLTVTQRAAMTAAVFDLRAKLLLARARVATSTYPLGGRDSVETGLYVVGQSIDWLGGDGLDQVADGSRSFAFWKELAEDQYAHLAKILGYSSSWNLSGSLVAVARELPTVVQRAASAVVGSAPSVLLVVGLAAAAYLVFTVRKVVT